METSVERSSGWSQWRSAISGNALITLALVVLTAAAWAYLIRLHGRMNEPMAGMDMTMPEMQQWTAAETFLSFVMWAVMMLAMMLPSAMPMILLFAHASRNRAARGVSAQPAGVFVLGYVVIWVGFSALAAVGQTGLHHAALLSPQMALTSSLMGGLLLIGAGVYQWLPLKDACLSRCRSPITFLTTEWREGRVGAAVMGSRHGIFCLGCCWALMGLLFVAGVMNLLWVAIIAAFVLVEKTVSHGKWLSRTAGVALVVWGASVLRTGIT